MFCVSLPLLIGGGMAVLLFLWLRFDSSSEASSQNPLGNINITIITNANAVVAGGFSCYR